MHRCYGFSALWRARGLPPTPHRSERVWAIGAGRVAVLAQGGGPARKQVIRLTVSALEDVVD